MQSLPEKELLEALPESIWFDADSLDETELFRGSSRRTRLRIIERVSEGAVSRIEDVTDHSGSSLNTVVLDQFMVWLKRQRKRKRILSLIEETGILCLSDLRGHLSLHKLASIRDSEISKAFESITEDLIVVPNGVSQKVVKQINLPKNFEVLDLAHKPVPFAPVDRPKKDFGEDRHLWELEQESIKIIREAVAASKKPGMLFSLGKDSMVMLRLAEKAFAPEPIPFPLVNIDTRWKFQEMNTFRDWIKSREDVQVIHYVNPYAIENDTNPFDDGSAKHTDITKTQALRKVLEENEFDFVFGGARRDEEKSRAKERIFSIRSSDHGWDPKNQRPELWDLYNTELTNGQSMRVFPLSNWTELDIWKYLDKENVPLVPLYFAATRPYVERNGSLIMVDDERFRLEDGEEIKFGKVRFRSLGCYPLSGGVLSEARTVADIVKELQATRVSERSSRVIDFDRGASMEQKKKEGYF